MPQFVAMRLRLRESTDSVLRRGGTRALQIEENSRVSEQLVGKRSVKAGQVRPGEAVSFDVAPGDLVQITTVSGKQVADFIAFMANDNAEYLSTAVTRSKNSNMMLTEGMTLYSSRRNPMFTLVEDTVGRHDILFAACDDRRYNDDFGLQGHSNCRAALANALSDQGVTQDDIPDPVNWFMYISTQPQGELKAEESLAERNDYVLLRVETEAVIAVSACPQDQTPINGFKPSDILVRIYR